MCAAFFVPEPRLVALDAIVDKFNSAARRLCLFDQDGTVADFSTPMEAWVNEQVVSKIFVSYSSSPRLSDRKTLYAVITGRSFGEARLLNRLPLAEGEVEHQLLFDQVPICGVFNHGQEIYIEGKKVVAFQYTGEQQTFLNNKLGFAGSFVEEFFNNHLRDFGFVRDETAEKREGGILIKVPGGSSQKLLEVKRDSAGHLSSFAFHSRCFNEVAVLRELLPFFNRMVDSFRENHINIAENRGLVRHLDSESLGIPEGDYFFNLPKVQISVDVDEVAAPYSKEKAVKLFIRMLAQQYGCQFDFILAAGDMAGPGETDRGMLEHVASLHGGGSLHTASIHVKHAGEPATDLAGRYPNVAVLSLSEPKKVAEMVAFLDRLRFVDEVPRPVGELGGSAAEGRGGLSLGLEGE